ncbi:hypothetical protein [Bradyrhizobium canariense]|nr:hypothetical protein [Bradyrhizobium canariense]
MIDLLKSTPDLTIEELRDPLANKAIPLAVARSPFFERHKIA